MMDTRTSIFIDERAGQPSVEDGTSQGKGHFLGAIGPPRKVDPHDCEAECKFQQHSHTLREERNLAICRGHGDWSLGVL